VSTLRYWRRSDAFAATCRKPGPAAAGHVTAAYSEPGKELGQRRGEKRDEAGEPGHQPASDPPASAQDRPARRRHPSSRPGRRQPSSETQREPGRTGRQPANRPPAGDPEWQHGLWLIRNAIVRQYGQDAWAAIAAEVRKCPVTAQIARFSSLSCIEESSLTIGRDHGIDMAGEVDRFDREDRRTDQRQISASGRSALRATSGRPLSGLPDPAVVRFTPARVMPAGQERD
jgi:hypothetical protein